MQNNIISITKSVNQVDIRLTYERWYHISESHRELVGLANQVLETISQPDLIVEGLAGELLALSKINGKYLVSVYREVDKKDGFVITAFYITNLKLLLKKRKIIWKQKLTKK